MVTVRVRSEKISYYHFLNVLSSQISLNSKIVKNLSFTVNVRNFKHLIPKLRLPLILKPMTLQIPSYK